LIRRLSTLSRAACRDERGAAMMEFAFVAPVMFMMIMAGFDAGYSVYVKSVANGALEARARAASLDGSTESQFDSELRQAMYRILPAYADNEESVILSKKNYTDYSRIDAAEKITTDNNDNGVLDGPADWDGDGTIDTGDCWLDEDGNGEYGTNEGADGLGGADDGVFYTVTLQFPRLFPLASMLGLSAEQTVVVRTLVINQPYGSQEARATECRMS
jgi:Flp pilus assembly protein TadG